MNADKADQMRSIPAGERSVCRGGDCFAALAMTRDGGGCLTPAGFAMTVFDIFLQRSIMILIGALMVSRFTVQRIGATPAIPVKRIYTSIFNSSVRR